MNLVGLKQERETALAKAEQLVAAAENAKRPMTEEETRSYDESIHAVNTLNARIEQIEKVGTLRSQIGKAGQVIPAADGNRARVASFSKRRILSADYLVDFAAWAASKGKTVGAHLAEGLDAEGGFVFPTISAAQYEGSNAAGGYAVPSQVEGQIIPLAPPEFGVQKLATVIPTVMDLKFPRKTAHGTAAFKSESGGSNNAFGGTDPTIDQFTLSAFMLGHIEDASWELLQDVPQFQAFMNDDILLSLAVLKETKFVSGSGSGEPQGLLGNTGAGVTGVTADGNGNLLPISATFDVMGTLNAIYHANASWLMSRASSIELRKAQTQSNLFEPVFTRVGGQDYLHGYPVEYSSSMPAVAAGNTPVLFGDFKRGYIIGERGGAGVNVKILDQTKAVYGLMEILGYQRVDGRVRRSEAIQAITLHT